jgi:trehalose 6-phosphate synthase/phosphatase
MGRLVIVSNRLPVTVKGEKGEYKFQRSVGGVATGIATYLDSVSALNSNHEYVWIGWPGTTVPAKDQKKLSDTLQSDFNAFPVFLSEQGMENFYNGFCNKTIWALFHYFPSYTVYEEEYWQDYIQVNEAFCRAILEVIQPGDVIWIHDYHLMLLPKMIKERAPDNPIGFFLHIPFPSFEIFRVLPSPWRGAILEGLLGADLIGFHTYDYVQHFLRCVLSILGHEHHMGEILVDERVVKADSFPMGIDYAKFHGAATEPRIRKETEELKKTLGHKQLVLSVDRLDYSKGISHRLLGYELFLERNPQWRGKVVLLLVVVPSRIGVHRYQMMKKEIDELVGKINGRFGKIDWAPIIYQYKSLDFEPLVTLYAVSDVILVTPLRDGMNLIAKEYVSSRPDGSGVLILSEMAGAAKELTQAMIINPNTPLEIARALEQALEMPQEEQKKRNAPMQQRLRRYDVVHWANDFIQSLKVTKDHQQSLNAKLLGSMAQDQVMERFQRAAKSVMFLDYDGTLVPFTGDPQLAAPDPKLLTILEGLSQVGDVVLISGRDRSTMDRWFEELPVGMVAEHGAWIKEKRQDWKMPKQLNSEWKKDVLPILEFFADRLPGAFVEEKQFSAVFHYREADPELSAIRLRDLSSNLTHVTSLLDLHTLRGNKVLEVRMAGVEKGTAATTFLTNGRYEFILAIGDDWTDEDLFRVLPDDACTVKVGIGISTAKYYLRNYEEVRRFLSDIIS